MIYGDQKTESAIRLLLMFAIMAAVWACLLSRGWGQEPTLAPPMDAVCKLTNWLSQKPGVENPSCSATLVAVVGDRGYVLTCDHVWHRTRRNSKGFDEVVGRDVGKIVVEFENGFRSGGRLLQHNADMDVSLVEIFAPPTIKPVKVVRLLPDDGPFTAIGYPWNARGQQRWKRGPFARWRTPVNARIKAPIISGYSGGLLANRFGEAVGVASGNDPILNESIYCAGDELVAFVERQVPR